MCYNNNNDDFSDFTVLSMEGTEFAFHKLILAMQSPPLKAMMTHDTKEKKEGQLRLEEKEEIVQHFVSYFYDRKVPEEVLEDNLESFLSLAEMYDLKPLKLQAEKVAIKVMTTGNMVEMFYLGDMYNARKLKEASEFLMMRNREVLKDADIGKYPAHVLEDIFRLIC